MYGTNEPRHCEDRVHEETERDLVEHPCKSYGLVQRLDREKKLCMYRFYAFSQRLKYEGYDEIIDGDTVCVRERPLFWL